MPVILTKPQRKDPIHESDTICLKHAPAGSTVRLIFLDRIGYTQWLVTSDVQPSIDPAFLSGHGLIELTDNMNPHNKIVMSEFYPCTVLTFAPDDNTPVTYSTGLQYISSVPIGSKIRLIYGCKLDLTHWTIRGIAAPPVGLTSKFWDNFYTLSDSAEIQDDIIVSGHKICRIIAD